MDIEKNIRFVKSDLARNIFITRKALGYNHVKLVEISGITRPVLSGIENQSSNPTFDSLLKLQNSLNLSIDIMFISELKFNKLQIMLKNSFENEKVGDFDLLISEKTWKSLMKYSGNSNKANLGNVAKLCAEVINTNFRHVEKEKLTNMILGASLGVVFQDDGFKQGLEFGAWLGLKLG